MIVLTEYKLKSILLIALDPVVNKATPETDTLTAVSLADGEVSEKVQKQTSDILDRFLLSDSLNKQVRIPIVIDDRLYPAQHVQTMVSASNDVTYDGEADLTVELASNSVTISIDLKSNLTQLSTIADIFTGVTDGVYSQFSTTPRVSFFSASACVFNGYIRGISRATGFNTDRETLTISIEKKPEGEGAEEDTSIEDTSNSNKDKGLLPTPSAPVDAPAGALAAAAAVAGDVTNTDGRVFNWFKLPLLADIDATELPETFSLKNVNNQPYVIYNMQGHGFTGAARRMTTVLFDNVYLPLGLYDNNPYYSQGYAVELASDGHLYLGVEAL